MYGHKIKLKFIILKFFVKKSPKKGSLRTIFCQNFFSLLQNGQF